jgi:aminodeoxychorismate synthase component I
MSTRLSSAIHRPKDVPMRTAAVHRLREVALGLPVHRYREAFQDGPSFLLDRAAVSPASGLSRWSFTGGAQRVLRLGRGDRDPFQKLRSLLEEARPAEGLATDAPPFSGGLVGWFGYEAGGFIEDLPPPRPDPGLELSPICFLEVGEVLAHDHASERSVLSAIGRGVDQAEAARDAEHALDRLEERLRRFEAASPPSPVLPPPASAPLRARAGFDRLAYARLVEQAKEHILAGDAFEICLTQRLEVPFAGDPWALYLRLKETNPAPYAAYLSLPEAAVVSASPERFLHLDTAGVAESRPIKGTRPRGRTQEEDAQLEAELAGSEKDRAENLMIVDLVRSDLGRVCRFHSVEVPTPLALERHPSVFQLVSTVRGRLVEGADGLDLVRACFPGGSMTGAPKIEAMRIIHALEPVPRGVYSGALGYLDVSGALDLSIVIRTIVCTAGRALLNTGGAVLADSDPRAEYEETEVKARALLAALGAELPSP